MRCITSAAIVFAIALGLRIGGVQRAAMRPFDDAYHFKRIAFSAQHFPQVLEFDRDRGERGAFCPWPPLYDWSAGAMARIAGVEAFVRWAPPLLFSLLCAAIAARMGLTGGLSLAAAPYLITISRPQAIDHHLVEPALVLAILACTRRGRGIWLGLAIAAALLVQPALIIAAGLAFLVADKRDGAIAFSIAAVVIAIYRVTRPDTYPDNAWFLGWPHMGLLAGAAVACVVACGHGLQPVPERAEARSHVSNILALTAGATTALAFPGTIDALLSGLRFLGRDPWLDTIVEFQPMFVDPARWGTDAANLGGGALLALLLFKRHRAIGVFAVCYLLLALSSRRFLVPAIPLFALAGAIAVAEARTRLRRSMAIAVMLIPPLAYHAATFLQPDPSYDSFVSLAADIRKLPPGRVLAPWSYGHAIDVIGRHAVIIDNFGPAPSEITFVNASLALLMRDPSRLREYCVERGIRYLALPDPDHLIPATAASIGVQVRRPRGTVWWRLHSGEKIDGFQRVAGDVFQVSF